MVGRASSRGVELFPSSNPSHHCIGLLVKVGIELPKLSPDLLGEFNVAFLNSRAFIWKDSGSEEWDQLFLLEDTIVLLFQVNKRIAGFAVPYVGQTSLDSQLQMVTYNLQEHS